MRLSSALLGNAAFTAVCAGISIGGAVWLSAQTPLPDHIWSIGLGCLLASYVPVLVFAARWPAGWLVKTIIALDWTYVAIASGFLIAQWSHFQPSGIALTLGSTAGVALFAVIQMRAYSAESKIS